jgi:hypothetical protein
VKNNEYVGLNICLIDQLTKTKKRMPSFSSLALTLGQATHLPVAMLWCVFRAFSCYGHSENAFVGILIHMTSFLTPSIRYRSQLTGGWFRDPTANEEQANYRTRHRDGNRAVPLYEQIRNMFVIVVYAEFMTCSSHWIYLDKMPQTALTSPHPHMLTAMLWIMNGIDFCTPGFISSYPLLRLGIYTAIGYVTLYGGLATMLGEGIVEVKRFITNWYNSAEALDRAKIARRG